MIPAQVASFFAKPAGKYGAIAAAVLLIAFGTWWVLDGEFDKGHKAGAADVTTKVQNETIRKTDEARQDKERANEKVRGTPIDAVIDGLR